MPSNFPTALDNLMGAQQYVDGTTVIVAAELNNIQDAVDNLQDKVGINSSAVATSHDYLLANKGAFGSGSTVFNKSVAGANAWEDLDLSSVVGKKTALVFLQVTGNNTGSFAVKPKGYGSATSTNHTNIWSSGCAQGQVANGHYFYVACLTDANGVVQIAYSLASPNTLTIKLVGYVK